MAVRRVALPSFTFAFQRSPSKAKMTVCPSGVSVGFDKKCALLCENKSTAAKTSIDKSERRFIADSLVAKTTKLYYFSNATYKFWPVTYTPQGFNFYTTRNQKKATPGVADLKSFIYSINKY